MQAVNLINETDLTELIKDLTWDKSYVQTIATPSFKDRDFVRHNKEALIALITNSYIKSKVHYLIEKYKGTEFVSEVTDKNKISEQAALGSTPYVINTSKAPAEFKNNILAVKNALHDQILMQIDQAIETVPDGSYIIDIRKIRSTFPEIEVILQNATFKSAQTKVQHLPEKQKSILNTKITGIEKD